MSANKLLLPCALLSMAMLNSTAVVSAEPDATKESRGKYLIEIGGCNDCHTAGFAPSGGMTPESQWLLGDSLGYRLPGAMGNNLPVESAWVCGEYHRRRMGSPVAGAKNKAADALVGLKRHDSR